MDVLITFSYSKDPLVLTVLKEFRVFPVDAAHHRLASAIVVPPTSIPTPAAPLRVTMPGTATEIEVVPINVGGWEGKPSFVVVALGSGSTPPAPITPAAHMMMLGHGRYLSALENDKCFPQGCEILRLHDSQCAWREFNPSRGVYNWKTVDIHLDAAEKRGVQVLFTICYTPEWAIRTDWVPQWPVTGIAAPHSNYPPRIDYFEESFRALVNHVKRADGSCRIQYFEAWNEYNALGFYNGTKAHLMEQQQVMWRVLKELAPSALLTTPTPCMNFTSVDVEIDELLTQGFHNYCHIISLHGYMPPAGSPGSAAGPMFDKVNANMAKHNCTHPVWDTEWGFSGYANDGLIPDAEQRQWISDALIVRMQKGVRCAIWFQWDNPNHCGQMCDWQANINHTGQVWIELYNSIHPLPAVGGLAQVNVVLDLDAPPECGY